MALHTLCSNKENWVWKNFFESCKETGPSNYYYFLKKHFVIIKCVGSSIFFWTWGFNEMMMKYVIYVTNRRLCTVIFFALFPQPICLIWVYIYFEYICITFENLTQNFPLNSRNRMTYVRQPFFIFWICTYINTQYIKWYVPKFQTYSK